MSFSLSLLLLVLCPLVSAGWTNLGNEFLLAFSPNADFVPTKPESSRVMLVVPEACCVQVEVPALNNITNYTFTAATYQYLEFDGKSTKFTGSTSEIQRKGVRITSTKPIAVFGLNHKEGTMDGFLAYPVTTESVSHLAMSFQGDTATSGRSYSFILVASNTNNTLISVKIRLQLGTSLMFQGTPYTSGNWVNVTLQSGDVLGLMSEQDDLTGSQIFSSSPVAVYSGTDCTYVDDTGCDHLVEGLPPATTLGREFVTAPLFASVRTAGDKFRMVALEDSTTVTLSQGTQYSLNTGDIQDLVISSSDHEYFSASKPIMLVQLARSRKFDNAGIDPLMLTVPPVQHFHSTYIFATPSTFAETFSNELTLIIHPAHKNGILLDCATVNTTWNSIPGTPLQVPTVPLSDGLHHLDHSNRSVSFGAYLYGTALRTQSKTASYGYPVGAKLMPTAHQCQNSTGSVPDNVDNDCDGTIDEELPDGVDNDGDGLVDEDVFDPTSCMLAGRTTALHETTDATTVLTTETTTETAPTSQKSTAWTSNPTQKSTASTANPAQQSTASTANPAQQSTASTANPAQQSTASTANPAQQSTASTANPAQQSTASTANPAQQSTASTANSAQQSTASTANPAQKSTTSTANTAQKSTLLTTQSTNIFPPTAQAILKTVQATPTTKHLTRQATQKRTQALTKTAAPQTTQNTSTLSGQTSIAFVSTPQATTPSPQSTKRVTYLLTPQQTNNPTKGTTFRQRTTSTKNNIERNEDEIPKPDAVYPMVAGITGITLAVMLVCLICVLDAKTMLGSLQWGFGNVKAFCARRCCGRKRRKKRNSVQVTNREM